MKNNDFESWVKEHKDINNNLAVPAYRSFCKAYEINFHFGDEIVDFDRNKHPPILLDEMPLHGEALSLFNFKNKPYHVFKNHLISFVYTDWSDFDYEKLTLDEISNQLEKRDADIKMLKYKNKFFSTLASWSTSLLLTIIVSRISNSNILAIITFVVSLTLISLIPQYLYERNKSIVVKNFNKKLFDLQANLKKISIKYEDLSLPIKATVNKKPQPFNPTEFPTLVKYDSQKVEDSVQKLMKDRSMTRQQALVNLEQDLSEIESR